jgi:carboxyl-terminal processing protease
MEVVTVNGIAIETAISAFLPRALKPITDEAKNFALRLLLAGNHIEPRKFTLKYKGITKAYFPDKTGLQLGILNIPAKLNQQLLAILVT